MKGEVVGINTAIIANGQGIGFAIPINMARQVMSQLIEHGKVRRGQLGVRIQDLTPDLAEALGIGAGGGALVALVTPRSPADRAGIEAGDVISGVNGERVRSAAELRNRIGLLPVGAKVAVELIRKGVRREVTAILVEAEAERREVTAEVPSLAGTVLGSIEPGAPMYGRIEGAVVLEVKTGSRPARAGLRAGDIVIGVDRKPVRSPDDVIRLARETKGSLLLQVMRDGSPLFIVIA
jgi:S1-C subfamily serine protease